MMRCTFAVLCFVRADDWTDPSNPLELIDQDLDRSNFKEKREERKKPS